MRVGMPMEQALQRFYERMPLAEVNFFVIVLSIQQKAGGNLSEALGNLSDVLRSRKLMKEKIKTMSSEAKASTMIIGSLPPGVMGMIHLSTPSYMEILFESFTGNILIGLSIFWMMCGIMIMKKMVSFKF